MEQSYPVPPPELVEQWRATPEYTDLSEKIFVVSLTTKKLQDIATQAAQWGADRELEACCEWFICDWTNIEIADKLRAARRPKPLSLKEQALKELRQLPIDPELGVCASALDTIRRALEALDD
jgi:hypothetical protein